MKNITLPANIDISDSLLLDITIPNIMNPISEAGTYTFAIATTKPGTLEFISNIITVSFEVI